MRYTAGALRAVLIAVGVLAVSCLNSCSDQGEGPETSPKAAVQPVEVESGLRLAEAIMLESSVLRLKVSGPDVATRALVAVVGWGYARVDPTPSETSVSVPGLGFVYVEGFHTYGARWTGNGSVFTLEEAPTLFLVFSDSANPTKAGFLEVAPLQIAVQGEYRLTLHLPDFLKATSIRVDGKLEPKFVYLTPTPFLNLGNQQSPPRYDSSTLLDAIGEVVTLSTSSY